VIDAALFARLIENRVEKLPDLPGCWLWTGSASGGGNTRYGQIWVHAKVARVLGLRQPDLAHRASFALALGPVPRLDLHVLHRCDVPLCCRPSHLYVGTCLDNMADRWLRGREYRSLPMAVRVQIFALIDSGLGPTAVARALDVREGRVRKLLAGRDRYRGRYPSAIPNANRADHGAPSEEATA
jgi:hypothetical protein